MHNERAHIAQMRHMSEYPGSFDECVRRGFAAGEGEREYRAKASLQVLCRYAVIAVLGQPGEIDG